MKSFNRKNGNCAMLPIIMSKKVDNVLVNIEEINQELQYAESNIPIIFIESPVKRIIIFLNVYYNIESVIK